MTQVIVLEQGKNDRIKYVNENEHMNQKTKDKLRYNLNNYVPNK